MDVEEVQRRLSAALQSTESDEQFADARWGDQQSRPAGQTPPPPPLAVPQREMWQAPGAVMIEEAPAVMFAPPPVAVRPQELKPQPQPVVAEAFTPEMPVDVRRPPRRMPELEEFPAPVQREYRNRVSESDVHQAESVPGKRPGLFERLAGRGRRADDSHVSTAQSAPQQSPARPNSQPAARPRPAPANGWSSTEQTEQSGQGVEYNDFFSRDRKV